MFHMKTSHHHHRTAIGLLLYTFNFFSEGGEKIEVLEEKEAVPRIDPGLDGAAIGLDELREYEDIAVLLLVDESNLGLFSVEVELSTSEGYLLTVVPAAASL